MKCPVCRKADAVRNVCDHCDSYQICSNRKCLRNAAVKQHIKKCKLDYGHSHPSQAALRFKVGDRVLCKMSTWVEAVVVALWQSDHPEYRDPIPYRCELASSGGHIYAPEDSNYCIRPFVENAFDRVAQAINCLDSAEEIQAMMDGFKMDPNIVSGKLLLYSAEAGHFPMLEWLRDLVSFDVWRHWADTKGRNILHILLANGHFDRYMNCGHRVKSSLSILCCGSDHEGHNCLHILVSQENISESDIAAFARQHKIYQVCRTELDVNYVEVHNEYVSALKELTGASSSFQTLFYWPNKDGLNARELAARLGKASLVTFLDKLEVELFTVRVLSTKYKTLPALVRASLLKMAPDPMQSLSPDALITVLGFIFKLLQDAEDDAPEQLQWMVEEWSINIVSLAQRFLGTPDWKDLVTAEFCTFEDSLALQVIRGPPSQRCVFYANTFSDFEELPDLSQTINCMADSWSNCSPKKDFIAYLDGFEKIDTDTVGHMFYSLEVYHDCRFSSQKDEFASYVCKYLRRSKGVNVVNRSLLLQRLLDEVGVAPPGVECFVVEEGQPHLLQWFCKHHCDIRDSAASQPGLVEVLFDEMFTCSGGLSRQITRRAIHELSIAEALCCLAACVGEYSIFSWLYSSQVTDRLFQCGGKNVLHIAVESGQVCIVKYLIYINAKSGRYLHPEWRFSPHICNSEGQSAFAVAFGGESEFVARALSDAYSPDQEDSFGDPPQHGAIWHGLRSKYSSIREWASLATFRVEAECFSQFLGSESSSKAVWCYYMSFSEQLQSMSFMDAFGRSRLSYLADEAECMRDVDGWFSFISPGDFPAAVIAKSIQVNRLDVVSHILQATVNSDAGSSHTAMFREHMQTLHEYALVTCGRCGLAAVIAAAIPELEVAEDEDEEDDDIHVARKTCREFARVICSGDSDVDALSSALSRHDSIMSRISSKVAATLYGSVEHANRYPSVIGEHIRQLIMIGGVAKSKIDWLTANIAPLAPQDMMGLLTLAASYGEISVAQHLCDLVEKEWEKGSFDSEHLRDGLLKAICAGCGDCYSSDPLERYGAGYPEVVIFLASRYLSMGFNLNHQCTLLHAVTSQVSMTEKSSSWEILRWLFSQGGLNLLNIPLKEGLDKLVKLMVDRHWNRSAECQSLVDNRVLLLEYFVERGWVLRKVVGSLIQALNDANNRFSQPSFCDHHQTLAFGKCLHRHGINIQPLRLEHSYGENVDKRDCLRDTKRYAALQKEQLSLWRVADSISNGNALADIKSIACEGGVDISASKDRNGSPLLHLAASHNRLDVVDWLLAEHGVALSERDVEGRTALQLSRAAGATQCSQRLQGLTASDVVSRFVFLHFHRRRILKDARAAHTRRQQAVRVIQRSVRMYLVYRVYGPYISQAFCARQRFEGIWSSVQGCLKSGRLSGEAFSWSDEKFKYDMIVDSRVMVDSEEDESGEGSDILVLSDDVAEKEVLNEIINHTMASTELVVDERKDAPLSMSSLDRTDTREGVKDTIISIAEQPKHNIELAHGVCRWLDQVDANYREMFANRLSRLALGDSTYALAKPLHTTRCRVFEAKLDAGQRILWSNILRESTPTILVWCVSKHDAVSRNVKLIERSYARMAHEPQTIRSSDNDLEDTLVLSENSMIPDPQRNVPLKLHVCQPHEISLLSDSGSGDSWQPPLRLTGSERIARLQVGTTLLLGRSGTGKTLCLSDRMSWDRTHPVAGPVANGECGRLRLRQLFVSRSPRLVNFVQRLQRQGNSINGDGKNDASEEDVKAEYMTLEQFLRHMEASFPHPPDDEHPPKCELFRREDIHVTYQKFRNVVYPRIRRKSTSLDAIVIWTQIRSHIKGSIEASLHDGVLPRQIYMDEGTFSNERCRLERPQREEVYDIFLRYQEMQEQFGWWDDCDRATCLLLRSGLLESVGAAREAGPKSEVPCLFDKVYVDEVQDNTQAEICLYVLAAGGRVQALCLAGDPAQAVVEGGDFRFEEIRSLAYVLSNKALSIARPLRLVTNFRSHTGILNCAAGVLDKMFDMFPHAAKVLPVDKGIFKGPRPSFCMCSGVGVVASLLSQNQRLIVLCQDDMVDATIRELENGDSANHFVLGCREAKGLEFEDVLILNYFSSIPAADQQSWKLLFQRDDSQVVARTQQYKSPQIEPQLKLLYTAVTRCCSRLLFVETKKSAAGSAFFRWLDKSRLAERIQMTASLDKSLRSALSKDEWRTRGLDFVLAVDDGALSEKRTEQMLERACQCFHHAGDHRLLARARLHMQVVSMIRTLHSTSMEDLPEAERRRLTAREELAAADVILRCLQQNHQLTEVIHLCTLITPVSCEPQLFERDIYKRVLACEARRL